MVNKITTPPTTSELIGTVNEIVDDKQDNLVSGTNIKTINNISLLGSGNIDIQGGGNYVTTDTAQTISGVKTISGGLLASGNVGIGNITNPFYEVHMKLLYLSDGAGASGYKFGIYQWLDLLTVTARSSSNSWLRDLWQCNANTGVTNFSEIPTIQGTNAAKITDINNPTITFTQGGATKGSFTLNQATGATIALDAGGGGSYTEGMGIDITNNVISAKIATSVSSSSTNGESVGAKLFYDTCGDIEALINAL